MRIASLRFSWIIPSRAYAVELAVGPPKLSADRSRDLWGWVSQDAAARACLLGLTTVAFSGHEAFFIVAPSTVVNVDSAALQKEVYPEVEDIRRPWKGNASFFDCSKAERLLGWTEASV